MKAFLLSFFSFIRSCHAILHQQASSLPTKEFDFVIVGGGTAGNVIANRLTEDPTVTVLVLEAGGSNVGQLNLTVPFFFGNVVPGASQFDWNYTITPQTMLNGRGGSFARGHVLGGTSSINWMFYTRGPEDDYNRYAAVTGDPGWSWNSLQPHIRKNEHWTEPTDHHNTAGQFNPAVHGFQGINAVSLAGFPSSIDDRVIQTTKQLSGEFPFNLDMNSGKPLGVGWLQATINKGHRSSSAASYLAPQFLNRPNLHVLINARVLKLVQSSQGKAGPAFNDVQFIQGNSISSPRLQVHASKEVVLSAGVIGTPFILMHSGIGDSVELQNLGIKLIVNNPSVGKNASDHPGIFTFWTVNATNTLDSIRQNATLFNQDFSLWNKTGGGPFGNPPSTHISWSRLPKNATIFKEFPDPSSGPNAAHIEIYPTVRLDPNAQFLSIGINIVSPLSRGSVTLASNDPFQDPLIDPGLLTSKFDVFTIREGVRTAFRFLSAPAWKDYIIAPFFPVNITNDDDLDTFIRGSASSTAHLVGTAAMSSPNAPFGVVNPDLRAKGITGLRIVDGSVFPFIPCAHPQAPTYIFAERAADMIKSLWRLQ
ncbi:GMC oxidoreductase [Sphaerobolus stellatus SS14]|nr:GMC oxidoreductase [Sphaerobolus stellatus SS14]